jgi:hypothetical protein
MKGDKKLLVGFILFAIFILVFGYFSIKNKIEGPFQVAKQNSEVTEADVRRILAVKDTDQDGLTDEQEIFTYYTSIYLADSDSDGYNDKGEVDAGSDPINAESTPLNKNVATKQATTIPEQNNELSTQEIRALLVKMGVPQTTIDQVDDETLRKIYQETIQETGVDPNNFSLDDLGQVNVNQVKETSGASTGQDISNLDIAQIRQLLLSAGANADVLSTIDDETLKQAFIEAMTKAQ